MTVRTDSTEISEGLTPSRALRLALVFVGTLFGLIVLSFAIGSSSASAAEADDSPDSLGSALGGLVSSVTEPVQHTVTTVTHIVQPITAPAVTPVTQAPAVKPVADAVATAAQAAPVAAVTAPIAGLVDSTLSKILGDSPLAAVIGPQPVGSILTPVSDLLDGTAADVIVSAAPVAASPVSVATAVSVSGAAAITGGTPTVVMDTLSGIADGHLAITDDVLPGDSGTAGMFTAGTSLLAAIAGLGFVVQLVMRRTMLVHRAMPGSPVFDTDSSPD